MSTRALRKVRNLREAKDDQQEVDIDTNSLENTFEIDTPSSGDNPFCLLGDEETNQDFDNGDSAEERVQAEIPQNKKKGKQKKRSKTKKKFQSCGETEEEDLENVLKEVNAMVTNSKCTSQQSWTAEDCIPLTTLLTVEHRHLNADNEMKRIFGARVVKGGISPYDRIPARFAVLMIKHPWYDEILVEFPDAEKGLYRLLIKCLHQSLSMTSVDTKQSLHYFTLEHNKWYQDVQFMFLDAVESSDPQNIMDILKVHPYHIDSLLQLSEICKMSEDVQTASDLLERALYVFETNFHSLFNMTKGNCRLDYRRPENRAFYLAVYRHLVFVGQRGCYRTALELCKLLLSFDPEGDPLCILLMIDFYAIQAEEYSFLIQLHQELENDKNLSQLPNFAFSLPLAIFLKEEKENKCSGKASELLQIALMMFPGILMPILEKCSIQPDDKVSKCSFFVESSYKDELKAVQQLQNLYIGRSSSCWKLPAVMEWLEGNVKKVITRVEAKDPCVEEYTSIRKSRYRGTPRNIYRHILISDIKEATLSLPPEMVHSPILSHDPLPPTDSIQSYARPERLRQHQHESNPLSLFFRSMLPNFNPQEIVEDAAGAAGGVNDARQGWDTLVNGLRDLLNNINFVPPPVENLDNEDENHNDDFD